MNATSAAPPCSASLSHLPGLLWSLSAALCSAGSLRWLLKALDLLWSDRFSSSSRLGSVRLLGPGVLLETFVRCSVTDELWLL